MRQHSESILRYVTVMTKAAMTVAVLFIAVSTFAQTTGTISGTATDQSGALVPGADITLKNVTTGDIRHTQSNGSGYFSFGSVVPGAYEVSINAKGFKLWETKGLQIHSGDDREIKNIQLAVGTTTETIEVQASGAAPVSSGERSALLDSKQIQNLSLEGRDATELVKILPGTVVFAGGGFGNQAGFDPGNVSLNNSSVGNGLNTNGNVNRGGTDLVSDGAHIIDPGCNCVATQTVDADMVAEVNVQTSNFGADSAKGPVVINAVGKSGSTEYHGETYLYTRNTGWNANDWLSNSLQLPRTNDKKFYPGGQLGGPIPGTHKKLLFFAGYEYYWQQLPGQTLESWVPTLSMRNGDFSSTAADNAALCSTPKAPSSMCSLGSNLNGFLLNGSKIPASGIIPSSSFDPGGLALFKLYPLPNVNPATTPGNFNFVQPISTQQNGWIFHTRVDYNVSDRDKVYVTYNQQRELDAVPVRVFFSQPFAVPFPGGMSSQDISHTLTGHFLHTFSSSLTNDFGGSLSYLNIPIRPNNPSLVSKTTIGYPYNGVFNNGDPQVPGLSNSFFLTQASADEFDLFQGAGNNGAFVLGKRAYNFQDDVTKVIRTHTLKFGFYWERTINNQADYTDPNGQIAFDNFGPYNNGTQFGSNNAIANQLLGAVGFIGFDQNNFEAVNNMSYANLAFYVSDSWKFNKRLTLDLGLRMDHYTPWRDDSGGTGLAVWMPALFQSDVAAGSPNPGLRWNAIDPSVPNGGAPTKFLLFSPRVGFAWDAFGKGRTVFRGGFGAYHFHDSFNDFAGARSTASGSENSTLQVITLAAIASQAATIPQHSAFAVDPNDDEQPVTYTYNFTISQQAPWKSLFEVAYVGNHSNHLTFEGNLQNLNVIPAGALFAVGTNTNTVQNANLANFRPFSAGFGNNSLNLTNHGGYANYNALQASWNKTAGLVTFGVNYTFSKALGLCGTAQLNCALADPTNLAHDYGPLSIDRSQVFNSSYQIALGNRFHGNQILEELANGWTIAGITSLQSGPDLAALTTNFNIAPAQGSSTLPGFFSNRTILGTPDINLQPTLLCNPTSNLGPNQFVNGSCFGVPGNGVTGSGANGIYSLPYIHGPAYVNSDLSLYKDFKITERQSLQFRASAFNFLNHPLTSFNPNDNTNLTLKFAQNGSGQFVQSNPTFGVADIKLGRRIMELALKYSF